MHRKNTKHEAEVLLQKLEMNTDLLFLQKLQETLWFTYGEKHKIYSLGENFQPYQYV